MAKSGRGCRFGVTLIAWMWIGSFPAAAATITVGQGGGFDHSTIQAAIDASTTGDTVIVHPGTYVENIHFGGKSIVLRSKDPTNPATVAATVIDRGLFETVVTFEGTETSDCRLAGFTIQNGSAGAWYAGGIEGNGTHATIEYNRVINNRSQLPPSGTYSTYSGGAGISECHGTIQHNVISSNTAVGGMVYYYLHGFLYSDYRPGLGAGLRLCKGTIQNNTITSNTADAGAGLYSCHGVIRNNKISFNSAEMYGGGLDYCGGLIRGNCVTNNRSAGNGGGFAACEGTIQDNTIAGNAAAVGGGLFNCKGPIRNCIIWGNSAETDPQLHDSAVPSYSCIQNWLGGGSGNITAYPIFSDAANGDFHLSPGSPCIDAGANGYWLDWPQLDLDGRCRLAGGRVDMGCYEFGASLDLDGDLLSDSDESRVGANPAIPDTDADGLRDGLEILRGSDPLHATPPGSFRIPQDLPTIQTALAVSLNGDEIVVSPGMHKGILHFYGADVVLRSGAPEDAATVAATVLDGGKGGSVIRLLGTESEACVLEGFTIINGRSLYGGGIMGNDASAIIRNNIIIGNMAWRDGGGLYYCGGLIQNNTISSNSALLSGGGLLFCLGDIRNNTIAGNVAGESGGGLFHCNGTLEENIVFNNTADVNGGGLCDCGGEIRDNLIIENWAGFRGGGLASCHGTVWNNLITGNISRSSGGGLEHCDGVIRNNTIAHNTAWSAGAGIELARGTIQDCIIWENSTPHNTQLYDTSAPEYCCIQDWPGSGTGNISDNPLFVPGALGAYYLSQATAGQAEQSPCVDAGSTPALNVNLATRTTRNDLSTDVGQVDMGFHYPTDLPNLPNLAVTGFDYFPRGVGGEGGWSVTFAGELRNTGSQTAMGPFWVEFRVRPIAELPSKWAYLCDSLLVIDPLLPGESIDLSDRAYSSYALPEGPYAVGIVIDPLHSIAEQREDDNAVWLANDLLWVAPRPTAARDAVWRLYR